MRINASLQRCDRAPGGDVFLPLGKEFWRCFQEDFDCIQIVASQKGSGICRAPRDDCLGYLAVFRQIIARFMEIPN
ncbi:hypothetical protein D9M73_269760 [compost metagenome]